MMRLSVVGVAVCDIFRSGVWNIKLCSKLRPYLVEVDLLVLYAG